MPGRVVRGFLVTGMIGCNESHWAHAVKVRLLLRTRSSLKLGALDLDADHALAEELSVAEKQFVIVRACIRTSRETVETIKIQLTLE